MIKNKHTRKTIAIFFLLFSFLYEVKAQGPNSPEAASFEPVDATDMVSLLTGDLSYVLPLLHIPSPEGGYPLALSYHAGIAMDQEASWVGLGWNLNTGAINRNVNGYPDDWGKTNVDEFFYDEGWTKDFYSISVGAVFSSGLSVGLGLSWGSNKSLSGSVSMGIGAIDLSIGENGVNTNLGIGGNKGFNANLSTAGVGVGYGVLNKSTGFGLNYNSNYGLGGSVNINNFMKNENLGISFTSNSINAKLGRQGVGINNNSTGLTVDDYNIEVAQSGFIIPIYNFYIGYQHTQINYSLFKTNQIKTSGLLYPVLANETYKNESGENSLAYKYNHSMDVHPLNRFEDMNNQMMNNLGHKILNSALVMPSYDKYNVQAQGISGSISPYMNSQLNLSLKKVKNFVKGCCNNDFTYETEFVNYDLAEFNKETPREEVNIDAVYRKGFRFSNVYNSFYRLETALSEEELQYFTKIYVPTQDIIKRLKPRITNQYNNSNSLTNERRREGNNVIYFTNKEIRKNTSRSFIEAKDKNELLDRSNIQLFEDEGIGAFQITALDGKIYHYSLPVYQLESVYKTFKNELDEDKDFIDIEKQSPYATHWLLTAITGPDYVDVNNNKRVDKEDYGYWVEFEHGKWSSGFGWRVPSKGYEEIENIRGIETTKTYSYSYGRKQVFYLDAVKTRTHTALFLKDIRKDNLSHEIKEYKEKGKYDMILNDFNINSHINGKSVYTNAKKGTWYDFSDIDLYDGVGNIYQGKYTKLIPIKPFRTVYRDVPINYSLKLDKIILFNNKDYQYNPDLKENDYVSAKWKEHGVGCVTNTRHGVRDWLDNKVTDWPDDYRLFRQELEKKVFRYNEGRNVLDVRDVNVVELEKIASKVIDFSYDYHLAQSAPNTSSGRLTLNAVHNKGKKGVELIPPFKFFYKNLRKYEKDFVDDWGYHLSNPSNWSLNEITTPIGSKIGIEYESDSYYAEAAISETKPYNLGGVNATFIGAPFDETSKFFKPGRSYTVKKRHLSVDDSHSLYQIKIGDSISKYNSVSAGEITKVHPFVSIDVVNTSNTIYGEHDDYTITLNDNNGKKGGGIRVKKISVINDFFKEVSTDYSYFDEETKKITGITSYAPSKKQRLIPYHSQLPSPLVTYAKVTLTTRDSNEEVLGSSSYEFETLEPKKKEEGYIFSLGEAFKIKENLKTQRYYWNTHPISEDSGSKYNLNINKYTIESKLGNIGRVKSIKNYNSYNQLLAKTKNNYKKDLDTDGEIGVTQESYYSLMRHIGLREASFSSTSKVDYPNVLESVEETAGGLTKTKYFDKYDFLTGQVLETRTYASDGKAFKTKTVPAYTEYSKMGSKVDDIKNKNMLTQETANYTYIFKGNDWKEIGVGITTWNNIWNYQFNNRSTRASSEIWRKHKTYIWKGAKNNDGTFNSSNQFNWTIGATQNNNWQKTSETTRYNQFSNPLEVKDINNNYASSKMGDNYSKVIATANANYDEMHYSGAEYRYGNYFDGGIKSFGYKRVVDAHTGTHVVEVNTGQSAFEINIPTRDDRTGIKQRFKVSVWVRKGQETKAKIKVNGSSSSSISFNTNENVQAGNWVLLNGYVTIPVGGATIAITSSGGLIQLDDFRIHPITSSMTSYVYNKWDEVSYITGSNGLSTHYIYDAAGRLKETQVEVITNIPAGINGGFEKVSTNSYNYKRNQ